MSANLRFFQGMIRAERSRVQRRTPTTPATPKPRADQKVQEPEVGLGSAPEIVKQIPSPPAYKVINGVSVTPDLSTQQIVLDWPAPDTEQAEKTSIGRRRPHGPGTLGITVGFWYATADPGPAVPEE